jgi:hypothetical protein
VRTPSGAALRASNALLVAGYGLGVWAALRLVPVWRQRRLARFLAFETGTVLVAVGWTIRNRAAAAATNWIIAAGLGAAWFVRSRRR